MKIILDAMGGDNAPEATIKGAVKAIKEIEGEIILTGNEDIINKAKKAREEFNSFAQKINSIEIIKYPTQKDIIKDIINKFKEFGTDSYTYMYLRKEFDKINIKLEIENGVEEIKPFTFKGLS